MPCDAISIWKFSNFLILFFQQNLLHFNYINTNLLTMELCVSYIFFIIQGASKKVLQLLLPIEQISNKNFCFNKQKCLL